MKGLLQEMYVDSSFVSKYLPNTIKEFIFQCLPKFPLYLEYLEH